jgi:UDP-glucose 4-epimerase
MTHALVVGGSGFIGSHVADALTSADICVRLLDRVRSPHRSADQEMVVGDYTDAGTVERAMQGCDVVYNFAGLSDLDEAQSRPLDTVRINILGNAILLDAARAAGVKRYVLASTIYVYSEAGGFYRCSKQACELYVEEYQRRYGVDYTILRYGTVYGRRSTERNSVHRYLKQALLERRVIGYGKGHEIREYIHVADAASCSVKILDDAFKNQHVILTGPSGMRLHDFLYMIREMVGTDVQVEIQNPDTRSDSEGPMGHYAITPYAFRPKLGRKLVNSSYIDLGQGLLDCLEEISQQLPRADAVQLQSAAEGGGRWPKRRPALS